MSTTNRLRVAIVLSELRPGGMERVVIHLARGLVTRGVEVLLVCLQAPGQMAEDLNEDKIRLLSLNSFSSKDLSAVWRLGRELRKFCPSVISVHDYASLPYSAAANVLSGWMPLYFTAHGLLYEGFDKVRKRNRFFARFVTSLSAVTAKVADRHRTYLDLQRPFEVIANGVPVQKNDEALRVEKRTELGCPADTFLFLAVGNPRPEKGFEDLIDAVAYLRENVKPDMNFLVLVAGALKDDDYCRSILLKVEEMQLKRHCCFLGFRKDTFELYNAADAFVLSSRSEGLPMVVLEAMMAGLPVVSTRVGGIPDALGDQVMLVDPAQPEKLAQAMMRLMNGNALCKRMGSEGHVHVKEHFGVERMVDNYIGWYEKALKTQGA